VIIIDHNSVVSRDFDCCQFLDFIFGVQQLLAYNKWRGYLSRDEITVLQLKPSLNLVAWSACVAQQNWTTVLLLKENKT